MTTLIRHLLFTAAASILISGAPAFAHEAENGAHNEIITELKIPDIIFIENNKPLNCRLFRIRTLDVKAGAEVGIHSHENRPGVLSIVGGEGMVVYAYEHEPVKVLFGNSYKSYNDIVHYAKNLSDTETLSIMTTDFLDDGSECDGKSYSQKTPILEKISSENDDFYANAPHDSEESAEDFVNREFFRTLINDIKIPEGKSPVEERTLRVRKITLEPSASTGNQDYTNRPTYIMDLSGEIEILKSGSDEAIKLNAKEAANLINAKEIEIRNAGENEASYFIIELWDPNDSDLI